MLKRSLYTFLIISISFLSLTADELWFPLRPHKFDMKRINFGMSYDEVYHKEKSFRYMVTKASNNDRHLLHLRYLSYAGVHMDLEYFFINEKLKLVTYHFNGYIYLDYEMKKYLKGLSESVRKHHKKNGMLFLAEPSRCQEDFLKVQKNLIIDYGEPQKSNFKWAKGKSYGDPFEIKDFETFMKVKIEYEWILENGVVIQHMMFPAAGGISHVIKFFKR